MNRMLLLCILAMAAVPYGAALGVRPLVLPDEFRYAEIPREMVDSGDWVVPRLDGVVYFEKPALGYWVTALSIMAFGRNAFAVRLPFAIATLATAALTWGLMRRFGPGPRFAAISAAALLSSVGAIALGTTAVLDALFALDVTACLAAFFVASERPPGAAQRTWLAVSGLACGVAVLTKGLLGMAIPVLVAGSYLLVTGRAREVRRLPWVPLGCALATLAPWALAIARADPEFWPRFVLEEHLRRFAGGAQAQHAAPFWYYLPVLAIGTLPWTSLLLEAGREVRGLLRAPLYRFASCWLVGPMLLLSASSGKLPTYALPCLPPLFLLMGGAAARLPAERLRAHLGWIASGLGLLCAGAVVLWLSIPGDPLGLRALYAESEAWKPGAMVAALLATGVAAVFARRAPRPQLQCAGIVTAMLILSTSVAVAFPAWRGSKTPGRWLAEVGPIERDAIVVADDRLVEAVCWQLQRSDVLVVGGAGELGYGMQRPDQRGRQLTWSDLAHLIRSPERGRPLVIFGRARHSRLPPDLIPSREERHERLSVQRYDAPRPGGGEERRSGADRLEVEPADVRGS